MRHNPSLKMTELAGVQFPVSCDMILDSSIVVIHIYRFRILAGTLSSRSQSV
jgi:hypothetical protein